MPRYMTEPAVKHDAPSHTAILLINLGTPQAPTTKAVRVYLREFLSDPRVVETSRPLWLMILNGLVLNYRPQRSAVKYQAIWTKEGSPLRVHTQRQTQALQKLLDDAGMKVRVAHAMRYGQPSIPEVLSRLKEEGCNRILLLPLYPQYSASTTATAFDTAFSWAQLCRSLPELRTVRSYPDHPGYIAALAASVREHWAKHGQPGDDYRLVMSYHGVPRSTLEVGDTTFCECHKTSRLLAEALDLREDQYTVCFQSRFGSSAWLEPYTTETLKALGAAHVKRVDVICPGFVSDCLETLEEIALEGRDDFLAAGGEEFHFIHCLNERDDWVRALAEIATQHMSGWPTSGPQSSEEMAECLRRARCMGAKR
ncbi:ferrochelatase [Rhodocyclus tenuis]|uniref:Ferrochelatase n=2 Tax=Rhodocyclus TaxID=1064 RepID=A0A6L5JX40_RHOTE|nr:ferrochelatase [Rhodocyclus gracilis]MQY51184.1 ferrochelatase [Rhodocyclus gracilis]MRD71930.1 ferrochelatase [Rhodocyclus gracilis]NJA88893.1 ferrochelatase [Rhodocyclus gracilis]